MGARYSDRFFGPEDGRPGDPDSSLPSFGLDLFDPAGSGGEPETLADIATAHAPGPVPWHRGRAARAAIVAALLSGVIAGAYGWDRWRDHEVAVQARGTVDVSSAAFVENMGPGVDEMTLRIRLTNEGQHPLTVTGFDPADPRLTATDDPPDPAALAPAEDYDQVLHLRLDCRSRPPDRDAAAADSPIVAQLRTADGSDHAEPVQVNGMPGVGGTFSEFVSSQCAYAIQLAGSFGQFYAVVEVGESNASDAVAMTVSLQNGTGQPERPLIYRVSAEGGAFAASWEPAIVQERGADGYAIGVVFRVLDCATALTASPGDMEVSIDGQLADAETAGTIFVEPSPAVAAELVRLAYGVCG